MVPCALLPMKLIKSRQRVADHGEVFTPLWLVEAMLDLVKDESERIDARFLEPACGSGNFIVPVLQRKLATVQRTFDGTECEKRYYSLQSIMSIYGIELLADNITECRANMLHVFADFLNIEPSDALYRAAVYVLSQNIIHGDALKMLTHDGQPIVFAEWDYLGKGTFQRRDFHFNELARTSTITTQLPLFAHLSRQHIFTPIRTYPPMTVDDLAACADQGTTVSTAGEGT